MTSHPSDPSPDWYKHAFRSDYLRVYKHRNDAEAHRQIDFLINVSGIEPPGRLLDLGCGDGRHAFPLNRRGFTVIGMDLSRELLEQGRNRARSTEQGVSFIQGDMRHLPFRAAFDGVVNFFTSFGYFFEERDNEMVIAGIASALRRDGVFLMDYLNPAHVIKTLVPFDRREMDGRIIEQTRWVSGEGENPVEKPLRVNKRVVIRDASGERVYEESVRLYPFPVLVEMMKTSQLEVIKAYGDFDMRPVSDDVPRLILLAGKT